MSSPESASDALVAPEAVVLVHGIWCKAPAMWYVAWRLRQQGYKTYCFSYGSVMRAFESNVQILGKNLGRVHEPVVHLVAHSYGGLVLTRLLDDNDSRSCLRFKGRTQGRLVLLGSPVRGAQLAAGVMQGRFRRCLLGRAARSPLVTGIDESLLERVSGNRSVGVVSGTQNRAVLGLLFGRLASGDGLVARGETHFPGAQHTDLPVTHSGLLLSGAVFAKVTHFLQFANFGE